MEEGKGYEWLKQGYEGKPPSTAPLDWGIPGNLTDEQYNVFVSRL